MAAPQTVTIDITPVIDTARLRETAAALLAAANRIDYGDDPHHGGVNWGPAKPCWHEWECPTSDIPHRCTFGAGHQIHHHSCPCGAKQERVS